MRTERSGIQNKTGDKILQKKKTGGYIYIYREREEINNQKWKEFNRKRIINRNNAAYERPHGV